MSHRLESVTPRESPSPGMRFDLFIRCNVDRRNTLRRCFTPEAFIRPEWVSIDNLSISIPGQLLGLDLPP